MNVYTTSIIVTEMLNASTKLVRMNVFVILATLEVGKVAMVINYFSAN